MSENHYSCEYEQAEDRRTIERLHAELELTKFDLDNARQRLQAALAVARYDKDAVAHVRALCGANDGQGILRVAEVLAALDSDEE